MPGRFKRASFDSLDGRVSTSRGKRPPVFLGGSTIPGDPRDTKASRRGAFDGLFAVNWTTLGLLPRSVYWHVNNSRKVSARRDIIKGELSRVEVAEDDEGLFKTEVEKEIWAVETARGRHLY